MFRGKSYFLKKEQGYRRPADDLEYPKGLILCLGCGINPVNRSSSALPLTNYSSKSCSKSEDGATTP